MEFKSLVDRDGSGTVTIDKQNLQLDGLVTEDGSIKETDAHISCDSPRTGKSCRWSNSWDERETRRKGVLDATPWSDVNVSPNRDLCTLLVLEDCQSTYESVLLRVAIVTIVVDQSVLLQCGRVQSPEINGIATHVHIEVYR